MKDIEKFLKTNPIQDNKVQYKLPYSLYAILRSALWEYYGTVESKVLSGSEDFARINNATVTLVIHSDNDYMANYYSCIINFQSFIEKYIVSVLEKIHPVLVRGGTGDLDILSAATWDFDEEKYKSGNTLNFNVILKRLNFIIENSSQLPDNLKIPHEYHFLKEHIETIKLLTDLRNESLHKGGNIPNFYALDLLIITYVLPIIIGILKLDKRNPYVDRGLHCRKNVISELVKIKLEQDYHDIKHYDALVNKVNYIWHLKALGRASLFNRLYMGEWGEGKLKDAFLEQNTYFKKLPESIAKSSLEYINTECPCCGTKSLLRTEYTYVVNELTTFKIKCIQCLYEIVSFMDEPMNFGILNQPVFT